MDFSPAVLLYGDYVSGGCGCGVLPAAFFRCDDAYISGDHLACLQRGKIQRTKPRAVVVHDSFPCDDCRFSLPYIPINAAETKPGLYP